MVLCMIADLISDRHLAHPETKPGFFLRQLQAWRPGHQLKASFEPVPFTTSIFWKQTIVDLSQWFSIGFEDLVDLDRPQRGISELLPWPGCEPVYD